jgi:thiamine pyrophosphokinase
MSEAASVEWHPARLLQDHNDDSQDFALLILNQPIRNVAGLRRLWKNCTCSLLTTGITGYVDAKTNCFCSYCTCRC